MKTELSQLHTQIRDDLIDDLNKKLESCCDKFKNAQMFCLTFNSSKKEEIDNSTNRIRAIAKEAFRQIMDIVEGGSDEGVTGCLFLIKDAVIDTECVKSDLEHMKGYINEQTRK